MAAESRAETSREGAEALLEQIRRFEDGQATALDVHYCWRSIIGWGYRLGVIEPNGDETELSDEAHVIARWHEVNEALGTRGDTHLDLLARPRA